MKMLIKIILLGLSFNVFAQESIDDLGTILLNLDSSSSEIRDIHYPNYRMGGGNGAGREIIDCLILDIKHSDVVLTLKQKLKLAEKLKVQEVRNSSGLGRELPAAIKGENVVFYVDVGSLYMTFLQVITRDGSNLNDLITKTLPPVRKGNGLNPPTGLVYVRDCRF